MVTTKAYTVLEGNPHSCSRCHARLLPGQIAHAVTYTGGCEQRHAACPTSSETFPVPSLNRFAQGLK